jgi:hypothetical protein
MMSLTSVVVSVTVGAAVLAAVLLADPSRLRGAVTPTTGGLLVSESVAALGLIVVMLIGVEATSESVPTFGVMKILAVAITVGATPVSESEALAGLIIPASTTFGALPISAKVLGGTMIRIGTLGRFASSESEAEAGV